MMKKRLNTCLLCITTIIACFLVFVFQSCENTDTPKTERTLKKAIVYFEGSAEDVFPLVSFSAYTEGHEPLYIVRDGDTIVDNKGTYYMSRGELPLSGKIVIYSYLRDADEWIDLGVTYRKRMTTNPSEADELKVSIQGYINDIQYLDTTHVMRAFRKEEKIDSSDYIYELKIR